MGIFNSGLYVCTIGTFTHWVISLGPNFYLIVIFYKSPYHSIGFVPLYTMNILLAHRVNLLQDHVIFIERSRSCYSYWIRGLLALNSIHLVMKGSRVTPSETEELIRWSRTTEGSCTVNPQSGIICLEKLTHSWQWYCKHYHKKWGPEKVPYCTEKTCTTGTFSFNFKGSR